MKSILFDFGGTLDTNGVHWSEKFWELYTKFGIPVSKTEYEEAYRYSENLMAERTKPDDAMRTMLAMQLQFQVDYFRNAGLVSVHANLLKEMISACQWDVFDQAKKSWMLLQSLQSWYALGVVSNFNGNLVTVVKSLFPEINFSVLIDSMIEKVSKPDPAIFRLAIERLQVEASETWVVGDSYDRDILPAKDIGCRTIWLNGKSWKKPECVDAADYIIRSIDEVKDIVLQMEYSA
jgi:putative hydrolase of the HAD superfamily